MDSNGKMLGFLISQSLTNLLPVNARAEEWPEREKFDVVTGRAVAPLSCQLEVSAGFARKGGFVIPMRTAADAEILETVDLKILGLKLVDSVTRMLPGTDSVRLFPIYEKVRTTAKGYPRRWAEIKKRPL
jgi:16S rRNA (guanine527-N7)-methyltransferase